MDHRGPDHDVTFEQRLEAWALTDLKHHWDEAYEITRSGAEWRARRLDGLGVVITAPDAAVLQEKIFADYSACPVPRGEHPYPPPGDEQ